MKKLIYLIVLGIGFTSCSVESLDSTENMLTADARASLNSNEFEVPEKICAGEPAEFNINAPIGSNIQVQQWDPITEKWFQVEQISQSTSNPYTFWLTFPTAKTYQLRYKAGSGGFSDTINVVVIDCCTESFLYVDNEDGTYTFTYTAGEDMNDAEVVFTFAQSAYVSGLSVEYSQNGNNGQTYKAVMDLEKCDVLSYTITLQPNCSGNSTSSNVWTDFKVNDISKKANPEDKFVASCN